MDYIDLDWIDTRTTVYTLRKKDNNNHLKSNIIYWGAKTEREKKERLIGRGGGVVRIYIL